MPGNTIYDINKLLKLIFCNKKASLKVPWLKLNFNSLYVHAVILQK